MRFDDHVSFIAPHSYEASHGSQCDKEGSASGRGRWWSAETRCRRDPSVDEHAGDSGDMKRVIANRQDIKSNGESMGSKAVDECVGDQDDGENEENDYDDDDTVASAITAANTVAAAVATATVPAITTSSATVTASCHATSKCDTSAEIVNKDKLHGPSATIHGCGKFTSATALRNALFHASPAESKRLPKLRKPQESMGPVMDEEQQSSAWQSLTLPVIPEPSIDQPHSSPPDDQPVKIEIPIESD